jgi:hypothetical protein
VSGHWSNGITAKYTTDGGGHCGFAAQKFSNKEYSSVTFSVTGITHSSLSYAPGTNHDPDGDSDGTSIIIARP